MLECLICGSFAQDDDIYGDGWCVDCMKNELSFETFVQYSDWSECRPALLDEFVWQWTRNDNCPDELTREQHKELVKQYWEIVKTDGAAALEDIRDLVFLDDGVSETCFARWLDEPP